MSSHLSDKPLLSPPKSTRPTPTQDLSASSKRGRPCDACRRRKSKCVTDPGNSICVLCKFHSQQCTYNQAPQPRKRSANTPGSANDAPAKRTRTILLKPGTGVEEYDALPGPSLLKHTLGLQNKHHTEYIGPNGIPDVYAVSSGLDPGDSSKPPSDTTVRFVSHNQAFRVIPDATTEGYDEEQSAIDEIEATAHPHGPDLVRLFFRIVHPSFPVLHKLVFLEKYARSYREFSPPLLAAVYLMASAYWSYDDRLSNFQIIDTAVLQKLAFDALQNTMRRPKLSTIQAGLLLSQWQKAFMGAPQEQRDRLTVQLVNLSHGLGLHLDCSYWDVPDWEVSLRRRIAWALYMQDKWTALLESRPSLISPDDWDVEDLSEYDFPETTEDDQEGSSEVERGRLVFMYMAHLSVILADILRTIFSAKARKTLDVAPDRLGTLLEWIKPLQIQLKDWFLTLPDSLKMDTAASMKLSSVGYLRLAYLAVEVCIHKKLLRTLSFTDNPDPTVSQVCRGAANERFTNATDFVARLQAQHLHSFWYFTSAKCCALIHSFGQALASTAQSEDEQAMYLRKLKEFKWALKVNSEAGASFMKQALSMINQSVRIIHLDPDSGSTITSPNSAGVVVTGNEASPAEQQLPQPHQPQQWMVQQYQSQQHPVRSSGIGFDAYSGDFTDADAIFSAYSSELDGTWLQDLG